MKRKLAVIGTGRMGTTVAELASENGWDVCAQIGAVDNRNGHGITRDALRGADVAVEFTEPAAAVANIRACLAAGCPIVVGTTGWYEELPGITREVAQRNGALFWAPNFAVGVAVFADLARQAGAVLRRTGGFDAHIVETHHAAKKDAPSGTAAMLAHDLGASLGRDVKITSVRMGSVPGTHEIVLDAPFEQITLTHIARDRRVFAAGALAAAAWLIGRKGTFTMREMLEEPSR